MESQYTTAECPERASGGIPCATTSDQVLLSAEEISVSRAETVQTLLNDVWLTYQMKTHKNRCNNVLCPRQTRLQKYTSFLYIHRQYVDTGV